MGTFNEFRPTVHGSDIGPKPLNMSFIPRFTLFISGFICTGDDRWTMRYQPGGTHFLFVIPVHGRVNLSLAKTIGSSYATNSNNEEKSLKVTIYFIPGTHMTLVLIGISTFFWRVQPPKQRTNRFQVFVWIDPPKQMSNFTPSKKPRIDRFQNGFEHLGP